ncbi:B3 domain-containing transcription repressor VAL2 isoform X1 [Tanacetum coccineum]
MGVREEEIQDRPEVKLLIPLFEKVLTAADTGRSRCLVLPKNCAEIFVPSINDHETEQIVCQDTEGEDWRFKLRSARPKNKGRMYVLDEFYLYVEAMELSVGDTVTFSRLDPERKLIIGYRKNSSELSSNHLPRAAIASTSRVRDENESPNVNPYIMAPRVPVGVRKKSVVVGSTINSSRKKQNMSEVDTPNEAQKPESSDHGGNGPCVTVAERVKIKSKKGIVKSYNKSALVSAKRKHFDVPANEAHEPVPPPCCSNGTIELVANGVRIKSNKKLDRMIRHLVTGNQNATSPSLASHDKAKGKQIEIGSTSRSAGKKRKISAFDPTLKESTEQEWSPRAPRSSKGKAIVRSSTPPTKKNPSKDKSVAYKIKNITLRMIASSKRTKTRNREPEPRATVEARVAPEQSNVTKKHPCHRTGCQCIICIQPPSGSKHSPRCSCRACVAKRLRVQNMAEKASQKPPIRQKRKVPEPTEPSHQQIIRVSHGSEENEVERREPSPSTELSNQQTITVRSSSEENQNERIEPSQLAEPSNLQAITVNRDSEENLNEQSLAGSHSNNSIRPLFDLNFPASDDDDEFVDPTHQYTNGYGGYISE